MRNEMKMKMNNHHILSKLHTISFNDYGALQGDGGDNRKTMINGHESYDNTLIMKSM